MDTDSEAHDPLLGNIITGANENQNTKTEDERKPLPRKLKYITAAAIFYSNMCFGCALNTYGPALTSLETKYETNDATISKVFSILTATYMVGALTATFAFNYLNRQFGVICLLSSITAVMFLTPHMPTMSLFFYTAGVLGFSCGCYDAAQFVWMMEMTQKGCPPYVQCQHFFYAFGTNLVGLIMAPFLDKDDQGGSTPSPSSSTTEKPIDPKKLVVPYTIIGGMMLIAAILQILLFIFLRYRAPPPEQLDENEHSANSITEGEDTYAVLDSERAGWFSCLWPWPKLRIVILTCMFYGAYQGMEMCTIQFFPKFSQNSALHLSESEAAYVLSGLTTAFAIGRGLSCIAVFKVSTQLIFCVNLVFLVAANIIFVSWASTSLTMQWTSSILFGIAFSSMYPAFSAYIERYLNFTNFTGGLVIVCGSGVAALYPLVVGHYIENNPIVLSYTTFFSTGWIFMAFGTLSFITFRDKTRHL